jgi:hypothetical protein
MIQLFDGQVHHGEEMMRVLWFMVFVGLLGSTGCGPEHLPGTDIDETTENKAIFDIVEQYRQGMIGKDVEAIKPLISPNYYENASTTDDIKDDYGYEQLINDVLPKMLNNVKKLDYLISVKKIKILGDQAKVQYEFTANYLISEGGKETWGTKSDFNEISLVKQKDKWYILSGL